MSHDFKYVGCFVEPDMLREKLASLPRVSLSKPILTPHVTVAYRPTAVDRSLFGTKVGIRVIGYGRDVDNEGLLVELSTQEARLKELLQAIEVPHITLSISQTGKPVNTKNLQFTAVEPFELLGTYGGYTDNGVIITSS